MATARVLVVDDEPAVLSLASLCLAGSGFEVVSAPDGPHALELVKTGPPIDVVVSDVVMPGMQGPELLEAIRRVFPLIGSVLMSGYTPDSAPPNVEFLPKPFTPKDLIGVVRRTIEKARRITAETARECERTIQLCTESSSILEASELQEQRADVGARTFGCAERERLFRAALSRAAEMFAATVNAARVAGTQRPEMFAELIALARDSRKSARAAWDEYSRHSTEHGCRWHG